MARSRLLIVTLGVLAASTIACDALLGLGGYKEVDGVDSGTGTGAEDGGEDADSGFSVPKPDAPDAADAPDAGDEDAADASVTIDGPVGPPLLERWAQWPMPNPDAAISSGADASLPNPMTYHAGSDGGAATVFDNRTHLVWSSADYAA